MPSNPSASSSAAAGRRLALQREAVLSALGVGLLLAGAAAAFGHLAGLGPWQAAKALVVFAASAAIAIAALGSHAHARFGAANQVTLIRLAMVALFAGLIGEDLPDPAPVAWAVVVLATAGALLDAADGPLARASGLASDFGARFDMETDALLILVLCGLVIQFDKAGAWVLAAGLLRYLFVAAARLAPWLARPLAPNLRRKAICVAQITGLIICIGPIVPRGLSQAIAGLTLAALVYSFAGDVAWLARSRHRSTEASP